MIMTPEQIQASIKGFFVHLGVSVQDLVYGVTDFGQPYVLITVEEKYRRILVGGRGDVLRSINTIFQDIVVGQGNQLPDHFFIDVNRYRLDYIDGVSDTARTYAERAKFFKKNVVMEPMSGFERMIVHSVLKDDLLLETESIGEGKMRRVEVVFID